MLNFYRRFLLHIATTQAPLHALLAGERTKGSQAVTWTPALSQAFEKCKASLSHVAMLAHPDGASSIALVTDASTTAMGAVLQQRAQNAWQPLIFFSKKMSTAEQKCSAHDREPLAFYEAVKHFRRMLVAWHFVMFTDHKPLTYAFSQRRDNCSPRQFKHLVFISQFTTDIRYISGQDNVVADALSRVEAVGTSVSPEALAEAQDTDAELITLLQGATALRLGKIQVPSTDIALHCDTTITRPRPYVPATLRRQVFDSTRSWPPRNKGDGETYFPAVRVAWRAEGLPHLGTSMPVLPAVKDIQAHHHATWRPLILHPGSSTCTSTSLAHFQRQTLLDTALRQ
jgi:hypothetical protein